MDYCQTCRRHLNGALACPGCGVPAEVCHAYGASFPAPGVAEAPGGGYVHAREGAVAAPEFDGFTGYTAPGQVIRPLGSVVTGEAVQSGGYGVPGEAAGPGTQPGPSIPAGEPRPVPPAPTGRFAGPGFAQQGLPRQEFGRQGSAPSGESDSTVEFARFDESGGPGAPEGSGGRAPYAAGAGPLPPEEFHEAPDDPELDAVAAGFDANGTRAARRSRRAHRRKRRTIMLATTGVLLAAGGLSMAEVGMESSPEPESVAAPDTDPSEPAVIPTDDDTPSAPAATSAAPVVEHTTAPRDVPVAKATSSTPSADDTPRQPDWNGWGNGHHWGGDQGGWWHDQDGDSGGAPQPPNPGQPDPTVSPDPSASAPPVQQPTPPPPSEGGYPDDECGPYHWFCYHY